MKWYLLVLFGSLPLLSAAQDASFNSVDTIHLQQTLMDSVAFKPIDEKPQPMEIEENATSTTSLSKKQKWKPSVVHLLIGFDYAFYHPLIQENDIFHSTYYPVKDSAPVWADRETKTNLSKQYKASNIQFSLQANFWKGLYFGMNYQFTTIKKYKKDPNLGNLLSRKNAMFFIVSAQFGYVFEFLKNKALQIHPSIRIGGFAADDYYDSGTGKKFYFGTDFQIRYLIKRKAGFSLGFDYDFLRYQKKGYSDIFDKNTYQKTTFNNLHLKAGLYINVAIDTKK